MIITRKEAEVTKIEEKPDYSFMKKVCDYYEDNEHSINAAAEKFNITRAKVRKILVTMGAFSNKISIEAEKLRDEGYSVKEIAEKLNISVTTVSTYLPYSTVMYGSEERSLNAIRHENYRLRNSKAKEKTNKTASTKGDRKIMEEMRKQIYEQAKASLDAAGIKLPSDEEFLEQAREEFYPGLVNERVFFPDEFGEDVLKKEKCCEVCRLHLELVGHDYDGSVTGALHKYGGVKRGDNISRDILVPSDIQLWSLHYLIQRAFGWQNSHLHRFYLSEERMKEITEDKVGNWTNLCGLVFRSPKMDQDSEFWADDYESGSFKTWLKKKYTGPYADLNQEESYWYIREAMCEYQDYSKILTDDCLEGAYEDQGAERDQKYVVKWQRYKDGEPFIGRCYPESERARFEKSEKKSSRSDYSPTTVKEEILPFKDLPLDALRWLQERPADELLERMSIQFVLALGEKGLPEKGYEIFDGDLVENSEQLKEEIDEAVHMTYDRIDTPLNQPDIGGITKELFYEYDFGDEWTVKITGSFNCADMIEEGLVTQEELDAANLQVRNTYRPVMIARDGTDLVDDMGGYGMIRCFLRAINDDKSMDNEMYDDKKSTLEWARSLGWSNRNVALKNRL